MRILLGLLGDTAKIELYDESFYSLHNQDKSNSTFYLIGASESDVTVNEYKEMYQNFIQLNRAETLQFNVFSHSKGICSRIGLFPSSVRHLIHGPGFVFAPFPLNSANRYLKIKAKFLYHVVKIFSSRPIIPINYIPFGGLAARRTQTSSKLGRKSLTDLITSSSNSRDWLYIEAGSGQNHLDRALIQDLLNAKKIHHKNDYISTSNLVPRSIYVGGINSLEVLDDILDTNTPNILLPNCIIVGNISETNISVTRKIVERVGLINKEYFR